MNQEHVHLYIFDSLSDWEASYAIAGINNPQFQRNPGRFCIRTVAPGKKTVTTAGGMVVKPDRQSEDLSPADSAMLILPGGTAWDEGKNREIVDLARLFLDAGKLVAAICGATAGLARGGVLDQRRHTSNAREYLETTRYKGAPLYEQAPAVTDGHLITASGMAPVDFAYHIFQALEIYTPHVLDAWYGLFTTGRPEYFWELMNAAGS